MCHVILALPVIGLAVFWIWPLSIALPVYLVILSISGLFYFAILKAMHRPVVTGRAGLIGRPVDVLDVSGRSGHVRLLGEIWRAVFDDLLRQGDRAWVVGVTGLTLRIAKQPPAPTRPGRQVHCAR